MTGWAIRFALLALAFVGRAHSSKASDLPAGTFRFAEEVKLVTLDPQQHSGGGISCLRPVYDTLFERAPDGHATPLLATGYAVDGLTMKITLRDGVTFSDGERFDANAVVANINRGAGYERDGSTPAHLSQAHGANATSPWKP